MQQHHPLLEETGIKGRAIARNFTGMMAANGFVLVNDIASQHYKKYKEQIDCALKPNTLVFKRSEGSNFFVFARVENDKLIVHYTNPDSSEAAFALKRKDIIKLHELKSSNQIIAVVDDIIKMAAQKSKNVYKVVSHGHCRYIRDPKTGKVREVTNDDGVSAEIDVLLNEILTNVDFNAARTPHNGFDRAQFEAVKLFEEAFFISTVPAVEITLRMRDDKSIENGPHVLAYFVDADTAQEFNDRCLMPRTSPLPGVPGEKVYYPRTIEELYSYVSQKKAAVVIAHPAGSLSSTLSALDKADPDGRKRIRLADCGVINAVAHGALELNALLADVERLHAGVEAFNPTVSPKNAIDFGDRTVEQAYFLRVLLSHLGRLRGRKNFEGGAMTERLLSMTFADEMNEKKDSVVLVGHDFHSMNPMKFRPWVGKFMRLWNEFTSDLVPTPQTFVNAILARSPVIRPVLFAKLVTLKDNGEKVLSLDILRERAGGRWENLLEWLNGVKGFFINARDAIESRLA